MASGNANTEKSGSAPPPAPLMLSVSGCRGVVGSSLTPEAICRYTGAFAAWLKAGAAAEAAAAPTVVVGRDGRLGGSIVAQLAIGALRAAGCRVVDLGVAATPTIGVMIGHHRAAGGLVVTASHNPAEWNGLKCVTADGCAPDAASAAAIIDRFNRSDVAVAPYDKLGASDADDTGAHVHVARVLRAIAPIASADDIRRRKFRVAVDSVNCSGRIPAKLLLDALGCEAINLHDDATGRFPHTPEPIEENLRGLCDAVRHHRCVAGFAQDPDADRLAIVDEQGRFIGEEHTLVLAAEAIFSASGAGAKGAGVAVNLSTSRMIDDVAPRYGARVVRTPVGEANVVAGMRREKCLFGGEGNGGLIWPDVVLIRDSVAAMALVLALMTREQKTVGELVARTPSYAIVKRKAPVRPGLAERAVEAIGAKHAAERVDRQDGVRVDFTRDAAWLHVRPSNTEPIIRLIAEAPTAQRAGKILDDAEAVVRAL